MNGVCAREDDSPHMTYERVERVQIHFCSRCIARRLTRIIDRRSGVPIIRGEMRQPPW